MRWVAVAIITALVLAVACFFMAASFWLAALFAVPHAGAFGTAAADLHFTAEQYEAFEAEARSLRAWSSRMDYLSLGLVAASAFATVWCGIQTWTDVRRWHWFSFLGLVCLLAIVVASDSIGTASPAMLVLLVLDALAFVGSALDVRRRQYGTPGRIVAWATGLLAVALGVVLWSEALGQNGFIGRCLRFGTRGSSLERKSQNGAVTPANRSSPAYAR